MNWILVIWMFGPTPWQVSWVTQMRDFASLEECQKLADLTIAGERRKSLRAVCIPEKKPEPQGMGNFIYTH